MRFNATLMTLNESLLISKHILPIPEASLCFIYVFDNVRFHGCLAEAAPTPPDTRAWEPALPRFFPHLPNLTLSRYSVFIQTDYI